ncbi:MAG: hypothetical protein WD738_10375 [Pirellulales bacterium]
MAIGFSAADPLAGVDRLTIEVLVLLHVGEVDHQVKFGTGQHLIDMRIMICDVEAPGLAFGAIENDIGGADKLDVRTLRQMGQVCVRYAAAANDADSDAAFLSSAKRAHSITYSIPPPILPR